MACAAAVGTALTEPWVGGEGGAAANVVARSAATGAAITRDIGGIRGHGGNVRENGGLGEDDEG